ncbi:zinc finger protein 62 homolog [Centropristis striata]|uniref:zinc finger protein 62 homolog n=1 Tax=Centropristis striata TaxID=184440 RepID=UPI0027E1B0E6|nr:zinc finger protein 62 homolog [Centropristis striata]
MSEDSSSDEDWRTPTKRHVDDAAHRAAKCWECGKKFYKITNLMSHYKSHDIEATCHICEVTFRRLTSLSTHLDNAHSPPFCKKCHQYFSNGWDLNKHAEAHCIGAVPFQEAPSPVPVAIYQTQNNDNFPDDVTAQGLMCDPVSDMRPQQRSAMMPDTTETPENSVEYIIGEDDRDMDMDTDSNCEKSDDSTSSESDDEVKTRSKPADLCANDPESDDGSSSTDCSSDSSNSPHSKNSPAALPAVISTMCDACGRGPFRSMKLHLLHCSGVRVKYQCTVCKGVFVTESSLKEHYMPLFSCEVCGQVFPRENSYRQHQCPKGKKSPLALFCTESMPHACNICKSFFTTDKTLFNHVARVHTSVVSTKVCIITNPSALTDKKVSAGVPGSAAQSAISSPSTVNQAMNGKLCVRPPSTMCMAPSAGRGGTNQPVTRLSASLLGPPGATDTAPSPAASDLITPPTPTIMAMFENDSKDAALVKRMKTGWRSKAPYPCRHCGAILRQPSLIIIHRYLHRGRRSHQCQCGRTFKHRLHLLRHCVQHAETVSYICVSCGETFTGAKLLAEHMKGKSRIKSRSGRTWKHKVKKKCRMRFTCDCGQLFVRPSAYIWHQLKNWTKTKRLKKPLE